MENTLLTRIVMLEHAVSLLVRASPHGQLIAQASAEIAAELRAQGASADCFRLSEQLEALDFTAGSAP